MWYNYTNSRRDKGRPYGIDKYKEFYCCKEYSESIVKLMIKKNNTLKVMKLDSSTIAWNAMELKK